MRRVVTLVALAQFASKSTCKHDEARPDFGKSSSSATQPVSRPLSLTVNA
uniref:Secreted protein n=1 Tax=Echinococcus granulosus TaxID=6210 RepID=A0A068WZ87_ECHGR|nr:hypothetical protein EgrG_000564100 [Echinococcus granulosus]